MKFIKKKGGSTVSGDFTSLDKLVSGLSGKYFIDIGIFEPSIAHYMAVHEFGSPSQNLPERSWLRMPLRTKKKEIEKAVKKRLTSLLEQGNVKGVYKLFGKACEAQIQKAFETGGFGTWAPSNSPSPLIDTGAAKNAVTSEVKGS